MPAAAPEHSDHKLPARQTVLAVLAIAALILSAYSNTFDASWHFDDEQNIVNNRRLHLTELTLENIGQTFIASMNGRGDLYRPVACFTFALNYYFGKDHVCCRRQKTAAFFLCRPVFFHQPPDRIDPDPAGSDL